MINEDDEYGVDLWPEVTESMMFKKQNPEKIHKIIKYKKL